MCYKSERSISLSSAFKKTHRRGDKKAVHFADSLGLDLVNVHPLYSSGYDSFEDLYGTTPPLYISRFNDHYQQFNHQPQRDLVLHSTPYLHHSFLLNRKVNNARSIYLHTDFITLGSSEWVEDGELNEKLIRKMQVSGVCLKSVNTIGTNLNGIIVVANYSYKKEVWIRYTMDKWRSYADLPALYVGRSKVDNIDMFSFSLFLPQGIPVGAKCEFCIRYLCDGKEYWDNNDCANYTVECKSLNDDDEGYFSMKRKSE